MAVTKSNFLNNLYTGDATKYRVIPHVGQTFDSHKCVRSVPLLGLCATGAAALSLHIFCVLLRGARRAYSYLVMRRSHSSCLGARGYFRRSFPCGKVQAAEVRYHSRGSSNTNRL